MQSQLVFQEENEVKRLRVQSSLLASCEASALTQLFGDGKNLSILDVGCNDGRKAVERFSVDSVSRVIGIEYSGELAAKAQKLYGDERFSFYTLDVETADFAEQLHAIMEEKQIDGFDLIYLSFVLMHLSDVNKLLTALRPLLKADGKLLVIEADDPASVLSNDTNGLLPQFLELLKKDKYSGNREVGTVIEKTLTSCGYESIQVWCDAVSAGKGEAAKKQAIYTTFFTYLPEDVLLLRDAEPDNEEYAAWSAWLDQNLQALRHLILQEDSVISMGMKIVTCTKGNG